MATGTRHDPYRGFNFRLEIDGVVRAGFHEASGLHHEAAEAEAVRKLVGLHKSTDITLKRGFAPDSSLWNWYQAAATASDTQRKNGSIVLMDESGEEKLRWNFTRGWPVKLEGPGLNAETSEVAIETLEIACEGLELA